MSLLGSVARRLAALVRRRQLEEDLEDELSFHLEMRRAAHHETGADPAQARLRALRQFGNRAAIKEQARDAWTFSLLESSIRDLRFATRALRRSPAFTIGAIATLAVAVSITTAMFTVIDALVLRPTPFQEAGQLAFIFMGDEHGGRLTVRPEVLRAWRDSPAFAGAESAVTHAALIGSGQTVTLRGMATVTPGVFGLLGGVHPIRGRLFDSHDGQPGADDRVLLSEDVWRGIYHADPALVGSRIQIDGQAMQVIGILPSDFRFPAWDTAIWRAIDLDLPRAGSQAMAYVRFALTLPQGDALRLATAAARAADPQSAQLTAIATGLSGPFGDAGAPRSVGALTGGVLLVFVALCANVAGLLLTRLSSRRRQFSVCSALGASRSRVMRQACAESCVMGLLAVIAGVAGAWLLVALARAYLPDAFVMRSLNPLNIDRRALLAASLSGLCAILVAGLIPSWIGTGSSGAESLRLTDRSGTATRRSRQLTRALLIAELALACTLLVSATVLIRSFLNLEQADRGLDAAGAMTATLSLPTSTFPTIADRSAAARQVEEALRTLPGVAQTAWSYGLPPDGGALSFGRWDAESVSADLTVNRYHVGADFFSLYRIPILRGRTFLPSDGDGAVVIGERLAGILWPAQDPLGQSFRFDREVFQVIGVAREIRLPSLDPTRDRPAFYERFAGVGTYAMLSVRCDTTCPSRAEVQQRILTSMPTIAVNTVKLAEAAYDDEIARPRATAALGFAFAALAVFASAAGLFSLLSYTAASRRREFGIRTALGASGAQIRYLVVRDALTVSIVGTAIGAGLAFALSRSLTPLAYGVSVSDPLTWGFVIGLLGLTTLAAAWRPAQSAARLDPVRLLRDE